MSETNLYLYPTWPAADAAGWKKVLSVLVTKQIIAPTGEGAEEGEVWFAPGKRAEHLLKITPPLAFEDCRAHSGNPYLIPDGDTGGYGAKCPACTTPLDDALVAEAIVDFNEADEEDDRKKCPKCKGTLEAPKLAFGIPVALAPSFVCFVAVASAVPHPDLVKALEEATGCPWKSLTEKVEL